MESRDCTYTDLNVKERVRVSGGCMYEGDCKTVLHLKGISMFSV